MLEGAPRVVRRINVDALYLPAVKGKQRPKRNEIVAVNEQVFALPVFVRGAVSLDAFQEMKRDIFSFATGVPVVYPL